jgi:hypothetical protein
MANAQGTNTGELEIQLLDSTNLQPLSWGRGESHVSQVSVTVGEQCRSGQTCPQVFTSGSMKSTDPITLTVPTQTLVTINLEITYGSQSQTPLAVPPVVTRIACDEPTTPSISVSVPPPAETSPTSETATLTIQGHSCSHKEGKRNRIRPVKIETPTVKTLGYKNDAGTVIPPDTNAPSAQVTMMQGGVALVTMPVGAIYEINVGTSDNCRRSCPGMPVQIPVFNEFEQNWDICFEPAQPSAALFFVDSCGQPVVPTDIFPRGQGKALDVTPTGQAWLTGEGHVTLSSPTHELIPHEIPLRGDKTEAHVVRATPRAGASKALTSGKNECTFVFPDLNSDSRATVTVMKKDGELITTLTANEQGEVTYKPDDPNEVLKYVGYIDGVEHDTVLMKAI